MPDPQMPAWANRAERRKREREAAKARKRVKRKYARAAEVIDDLIPDLEVGRDKALERGWDDVAAKFDEAIELAQAGQGLEAQRAIIAAAGLAEAHESAP